MEHTASKAKRPVSKISTKMTITLSNDLRYRITKAADRRELSLSRLINTVVAEYLNNEDSKRMQHAA